MRYVVLFLVVLLLVLHQDYWQWDNRTLVFGFLPYSMFYHVGISLAAAAVGWLATRNCWPAGLDDETAGNDPADNGPLGEPSAGGPQP